MSGVRIREIRSLMYWKICWVKKRSASCPQVSSSLSAGLLLDGWMWNAFASASLTHATKQNQIQNIEKYHAYLAPHFLPPFATQQCLHRYRRYPWALARFQRPPVGWWPKSPPRSDHSDFGCQALEEDGLDESIRKTLGMDWLKEFFFVTKGETWNPPSFFC